MGEKSWRDCKLAIGVTANQPYVDKQLMYNLFALEKPNQYMVTNQSKHIKSDSLNRLVEYAFDNDCDKILFLDTDMEFPVDLIPKLISRNVPIVGGLYHLKTHPFAPVAGFNAGEGEDMKRVNREGKPWKYFYAPLPENTLYEVHWTGVGCLLVDLDVFNKIYFPCFKDIWDDEKGSREIGHDMNFCDAARGVGYKVYIDTSVDCSHRQLWNVDKLFVEAWHKSNIVDIVKKLYLEKGDSRPSHVTEKKRYAEIDRVSRAFEAERRGPSDPLWWDFKYDDYEDKHMIIDRKELNEIFKSAIPKGATVADFGCGYSATLPILKRDHKCECYAYDFSPKAIELMDKVGIKGEVADILNFNQNGTKYHTVILSHVLEHFDGDDVNKVLSTVSKMAEKQAIIIVPQEKPEGMNDNTRRMLEREHKHIYTVPELRKLLKKYFGEIKITTIKPKEEDKDKWINRHVVCVAKQPIRSDEVSMGATRVSVGAISQ